MPVIQTMNQELERIVTIALLMTPEELRSFLWFKRRGNKRFAYDLAEHLGVEATISEFGTLAAVRNHFAQLPKQEEPDPTFECVGCGALAEAKGLRWKKLGEGKPVTVSIDHADKPASLDWLTDEIIMEKWFGPWAERNPNVKFKLLKRGKGDCHIKWAPVDGPGGTLKFVWQPSGDAQFMEEGGDLSGDMVCDNSETSWPEALVHEAGKHEVGHVLGIGHLEAREDVMFPTARGQEKPLSINDQREEDERYPFAVAA